MALKEIISKNIRIERRFQELSQEELSEKVGVSKASVNQEEKKARDISVSMLEKYAKALGVTVIQLIQEREEQ